MKYKKYLKEKILEDGKIYEILNYQKTTNLFKIKMEEGIFLKFYRFKIDMSQED